MKSGGGSRVNCTRSGAIACGDEHEHGTARFREGEAQSGGCACLEDNSQAGAADFVGYPHDVVFVPSAAAGRNGAGFGVEVVRAGIHGAEQNLDDIEDSTADGERLLQDYELCLFRIAQECLTNIHRHSGSSVAVVRLLRTDREIKLEVSDEGVGISAETQSKIAAGETAGVGLPQECANG